MHHVRPDEKLHFSLKPNAALDKRRAAPYKPASIGAAAFAQVAQLVEHATENRSVGGSIPPLGTI